MNEPVLVNTDIVMVQRLKQSHDITQTAPQIAWTLPSTVIMYHSIPSLTIPPRAIFLMGEFPTPGKKEFKTPTPGL